MAQSALAEHAVLQTPAPQAKSFGQGAPTPALQLPVPLHRPSGVRVEPLHVAGPQEVVEEACSQSPPAAQFPVLPQGGAAVHWPAGAGVSARMLVQVPSAWPVNVFRHAWQVPEHATEQQTPDTH